MKTGKRIPISDAKNIGLRHGYTQVIITAFDNVSGITHVTTWGNTLEQCDQAAQGGNFVKKALGFPPEKCQDKPVRVKRFEDMKLALEEIVKKLAPIRQDFVCNDICSIAEKALNYGQKDNP